jgi:hypothetical protein
MMNWEGCGRKRSCTDLRHYPGICVEGLRKTTKILGQDNLSPGRNLNLGRPEYKAGMLTTRPRRSVFVTAVEHGRNPDTVVLLLDELSSHMVCVHGILVSLDPGLDTLFYDHQSTKKLTKSGVLRKYKSLGRLDHSCVRNA